MYDSLSIDPRDCINLYPLHNVYIEMYALYFYKGKESLKEP